MNEQMPEVRKRTPDLVLRSSGVRQAIYYPRPLEDGRCVTITHRDAFTTVDAFDRAVFAPDGIGHLLAAAGIHVQQRVVLNRKASKFFFPYPEDYDGRLTFLSQARPDFQPPRFAAYEDARYQSDHLVHCLGRRVMPVACEGYETVHDYETHVPVYTAMSPALFSGISEQARSLPTEKIADWTYKVDILTQLQGTGRFIASTSPDNHREPLTDALELVGFSPVDALRLAVQNENYRQDVIRPVVASVSHG